MKYLIAAMISLMGVSASYYWLRPNQWSSGEDEKRIAIAYLKSNHSDVKRKWGSKVIWSSVNNGDTLFKGDMIQTQKSSAVIEFIKTQSTINIDPDTTIIVEGQSDNINLNVLKGGLFVKNDDGSSGNIQIESNGQKVDLNSADASFSVGKNGELDVKVHKGSVAALVGGKKVELSKDEIIKLSGEEITRLKDKFQEMTPIYNQSVYISPKLKKLTFKWKAIKETQNTIIYIGPTRSLLTPVKQESIISQKNGSITLKINIGQFFWKLAANPRDQSKRIDSQVYKVDIKSLTPTSLNTPMNNEIIKFQTSGKKAIVFNWYNSVKNSTNIIQISKQKDFSNILLEKKSKLNTITTNGLSGVGTYYWRIVSQLPNSLQKTKSITYKFTVKVYDHIFPPKLLGPKKNKSILVTNEQSQEADLRFTWERVSQAKKYRILIEVESGSSDFKYDKVLRSPQLKLTGLNKGQYKWKVSSIDKDSNESEFSTENQFQIVTPEKLVFIDMKPQYELIKSSVIIPIRWSNSRKLKKQLFKIRYSRNKNLSKSNEIEVTQKNWDLGIKKTGNYYLRVYSLDKNRRIISKTKIFQLEVIKKSLPSAPIFSSKHPPILKANKSGKIKLVFKSKIEEGQKIIIIIKNLKQEEIMNMIFTKRSGVLHSLLPGRYWLSAYIRDSHDRKGLISESRTLIVPKKSTIKAPRIRRIKIR